MSDLDFHSISSRHVTQTDIDRHFLGMAFAQSRESHDPNASVNPKSAVGAVIANGRKFIASSANLIPRRSVDKIRERGEAFIAEHRYSLIEHAERSAIFEAIKQGLPLSGATMYCTRFPCSDCARAIVASGIVRLVVAEGFGAETRWIKSQRLSNFILRAASLSIRYLKPDTL